jgi:hypothetical protein
MTDEVQDAEDVADENEATIPPAPIEDQIPNVAKLFSYSRFVHVGEGAPECEDGENGRCDEDAHFHAWVRLPNQFQHETIAAKARAARARTIRALRDPQSDQYAVLEADLAELGDEGKHEALVETLASVDDLQIRLEAMTAVEEQEEFANRTADIYRRRELEAMEPDLRDEDELAELLRSSKVYAEAVEAAMEEIKAPKRAALQGLDHDGLIDQLRDRRIQIEANNAFASAYQRYEWFICTLKPCLSGRPQERCFKEMAALDNTAPEVIDSLRNEFNDLEAAMRNGLSGNW